jgi:hypothetical protein
VHNVSELVPFLAFVLFRIPLPLTPIQALSVDMATDSLTALGLGVERSDPQDMHEPPRSQSEKLLSWSVAWRAYLFLGPIEAAAAMGAYFFVLYRGGWSYGQSLTDHDSLYLSATTACLSGIIVMQIFNVFLCRSSWRSIMSTGLFDNRLIVLGVALEIFLAGVINYTWLGNFLLDTAPIPTALWGLLIVSGIVMLMLEEFRKAIWRRSTMMNWQDPELIKMTEHRFPPPWTVEETPTCFIVRDANGQALNYISEEMSLGGDYDPLTMLTKDDARWIASKKYRAVSSYQIDLDQSDEKVGLDDDAVGAVSEGAMPEYYFCT